MKFNSAVALMLLGCGSFAAHAADRFDLHGSLDNIHYTLVDLDPADGIAPSLTYNYSSSWSPNNNLWTSGTSYSAYPDLYFHEDAQFPAHVVGGTSVSGYALTGEAEGVPALTGSRVWVAARVDDSAPIVGWEHSSGFSGDTFSLSPHSALIVTATSFFDVSAHNVVDTEGHYLISNFQETAELSVGGSSYGGNPSVDAIAKASYGQSFVGDTNRRGQSDMIVRFFNDSDHSASLVISGSVRYSGSYDATSSVPEPGTLSLLLAGLAVSGGTALRRKRRLG